MTYKLIVRTSNHVLYVSNASRLGRPHKTGVINDPLSQTHSLASSDHCFLLLFCIEKFGRTDARTDDMCKK